MQSKTAAPRNIDGYIAAFPKEVQAILKKLRQTIQKAAPGAEEIISYQMPAFKLRGNLVYFAAWKNHIGFYPGSSASLAAFQKQLAGYAGAKGTVRFPMDKPLPFGLLGKLVRFRVKENLQRQKRKKKQ